MYQYVSYAHNFSDWHQINCITFPDLKFLLFTSKKEFEWALDNNLVFISDDNHTVIIDIVSIFSA